VTLSMELRSFDNGVRVSVLGIGCGRVASISNPVPMREIEATLEAAVEAGVTLFDTADIYGQEDSERTLSRLLRRHRDQMFVVTKVGGRHSRFAGIMRIAKPLIRIMVRSRPQARSLVVKARTAMVTNNFNPSDLCRAVEASRCRLGLDQLDGLLLHSPSLETLRNSEIHDFLSELRRRGWARHVGASVESLPEVEAALSMPTVTILQVPLSVANALSRTAALEHVRQRKIGVLVRGVLAGLVPGSHSLREAVSIALSPDYVTAAIVGVSTRHHLNQLLSVVS
jgi:aryl-alcohol dehydrogenase-like predicted oxidoreductase